MTLLSRDLDFSLDWPPCKQVLQQELIEIMRMAISIIRVVLLHLKSLVKTIEHDDDLYLDPSGSERFGTLCKELTQIQKHVIFP
ncbi:hypothetical protein VNO77_37232 [Canavalia gladiata]|uniref:Uncharacterized protein n=1 Tax=Canavalia gladiata TaxID=3824 RepID=A0AAN9K810_CANGL